jgi:hypothetical protein
MPQMEQERAESIREEDEDGVTLSILVERLGKASGTELFRRIDAQLVNGNKVQHMTVRAARESFSAPRTPRHARFVALGRASSTDPIEAERSMVMIAFSDLEAVVKASRAEFDWVSEFAPRRDLPTATTPIVVRSGMPARRMLRP